MSLAMREKPHVVCVPYPAQSHIKAMLKLAKLLHSRGIEITFVNTEYNHRRFLKSGGKDTLNGVIDFRFKTIPDGLPPSDSDTTQDVFALSKSIQITCLTPFLELLTTLATPVSCIISDGFLTFTTDAAKMLEIPVVLFWTVAACALMGYLHVPDLIDMGFTPLKDDSYLTNGYMDTIIDWIPGMEGTRLKDFPTIVRTTEPNCDGRFSICMEVAKRSSQASASIIHTFEELEAYSLSFLSSKLPKVYTIGPLQLLLNQVPTEKQLACIGYSLWKEESSCLEWLESKKPNSVLYVNFGSIAVMSSKKVVEFALGLARSGKYFLWIIRPDLVKDDSALLLLAEFFEVTKDRGFTTSWCPQEEVLNHPSIGGFLTHCGWNSTIESLSTGVPMICLPFLGDQPMNCRYACIKWEIGLEIDGDFKQEDVERVILELMDGDKGRNMKKKAREWKEKAEKATRPNASSSIMLDMFVNKLFND